MSSIFVLYCSIILTAQDATAQKGVVEGVVVNQVSNAPVRKATVLLQGLRKQGPFFDVVQSGADGRFRFESVPEGNYKILANRSGFVVDMSGGGTSVEVGPGGKSGMVVPLAPQAALSGRVLDEEEEPVQGAMIQVEAIRQKGGATMFSGAGGGSVSTNDRGEFRVFGLAAGKYRVRATMPPGMDRGMLRQLRAGGIRAGKVQPVKPAEEDYVPTYFPSTVSTDEASVLTLASGDDRQGIEIRMRKNRLFTVSGRVLIPSGWKQEPPADAPAIAIENMPLGMVMLLPAKPGGMSMNVGGSAQIHRDGSFEIQGVAPGEYRVRALLMSLARSGDFGNNPAGSARATVTSGDVSGIEISFHPPVPVNGTMTFRGDKPKADLAVHLISNDPGDGVAMPLVAKVDLTTGKFQLEKVAAGEYRVNVSANNAPDHYLDDVKINGEAIGPDGFVHIRGEGPVNLLLSTASPGNVVRGVAVDDKGEGKDGVKVVLWPESGPYLIHLVQVTDSGEGGKYEFRGVKQGKYRVAAFTSIELTGFGMMQFPPETFLKEAESKSEKVHSESGEAVVPRLKVIADNK